MDLTIRTMKRLAAGFHDERRPHLIEHEVVTLVGQSVFAIALGYEDLNDQQQAAARPDDGGAGRQCHGRRDR
jgi:hypothetical protein